MSKYTEEQISDIIFAVEKLIKPEHLPNEDVSRPHEVKRVQNPKNAILTRYYEETNNSDDYFEACFDEAQRKRQNNEIPEPIDYKDILDLRDNSEEEAGDLKSNPDKAVTVNNKLKMQLLNFRKHLEDMRSSVDGRLQTLEQFLEDAKFSAKDSSNAKATYVKCGAPFFKDALGYPAPENEDFKYRKNTLKEFFPYDITSTSPWENEEKTQLVQGIKDQMITHIQTLQSKKISQETKKTRGKMQKIRYIFNSKDLQETSMLKLYKTIQSDYPDFWSKGVNWNLISFSALDGKHTVPECMGMWHSYLRPDINREPFTDEENALLAHAVIEHGHQNWEAIASQLKRRTSLQTFIHYNSERSRLCPPNVRWTPEEDQQLLDAVASNTRGKDILWHQVGTAIKNRNKTQCYNRYIIMMRQKDSKKGVFKPYEDRILLDFVAKNGADFSKMPPDLLPNRSIVQIKSHYNIALKHKGKVNPWTREEDKILVDFVAKEGTNSWFKIAELLKTHNRLSCRTRYTTIQKFLKNNPGKTVADTPSRLKTVTAVHKAIQSDEDDAMTNAGDGGEEEANESSRAEKGLRSKSFGMLSFEEFKAKNVQLYNLMKTAYNYSLNVRPLETVDAPTFQTLKLLLNIDDSAMRSKSPYMLTSNQLIKLREVLLHKLDSNIVTEINYVKQNYDFRLPANYNTAIGLRAVAIKVHDEPVAPETSEQSASAEYQKALKRFQDLFNTLFYWPAMISKLKKSELRSNYLIRTSKDSTFKIMEYKPTDILPSPNKKPRLE